MLRVRRRVAASEPSEWCYDAAGILPQCKMMHPSVQPLETSPPNSLQMPRMPVQGRTCGNCTLCCKVVAVEELAKPIGAWCAHCLRSKGCAIYESRPSSCRAFYCQWMLVGELGPEWKPDRAKFALTMTDANHLTACVDPGFPSAWRRPPYYETLKRWAVHGMQASGRPHIVDVRIGPRCIVILPDRDVDLGPLAPDEEIQVARKMVGSREAFEVQKVKRGRPGM